MRYEIKLRIEENKPVEIIYEASFSKDLIYSTEKALNYHTNCVQMGRDGKKLSDILTEMTKLVIEIERAEDESKRRG